MKPRWSHPRRRAARPSSESVFLLAATFVGWLACDAWICTDAFLVNRNVPVSFQTRIRQTPWSAISAAPLSTDSSSSAAAPLSATGSNASTTPALRELYPPWSTAHGRYDNGTLLVGKEGDSVRHKLFYQIYHGNRSKAGDSDSDTATTTPTTALFLHGGPGAACFPNHVRFFDSQRYDKVILLDQRGCGQSTATTVLNDDNENDSSPPSQSPNKIHHYNTLPHLIEDIETLRKHLNIEQFTTILGGSWGSTLALGYAQEYPTRVHSLLLRGVCTMRQSEVDWLFSSVLNSASKLFPDAWREFESAVENIGRESTSRDKNNEPDPRSALKGYHIVFLTQRSHNSQQQPLREAESKKIEEVTRAWRKWEFLMSMAHKLPPQPNNLNMSDQSAMMNALKEWDTAHADSPVVVARKECEGNQLDNTIEYGANFRLEDATGLALESPETTEEAKLVRPESKAFEMAQTALQHIGVGTEPSSLSPSSLPGPESLLVRSDKIPAQILLTCHYSYYRDVSIPYELLDPDRMQRLQDVKCIAVQGGRDRICPPDTALDLWCAYPGDFVLRMSIHAGHSMYDPFLTNELVKATDQIADDFVRSRYNRAR